jgi:hypothetical protein
LFFFSSPVSRNTDQVEAILEALSTIGDVGVALPSTGANLTACDASYGAWSAGVGNYRTPPKRDCRGELKGGNATDGLT